MEIAARIFALVKERGLEQKEFAALIGKTDKTVSSWANGRSSSYLKCLPEIAEVLRCSVEYLVTGKTTEPTDHTDGLSAAERGLLGLFRRLSPDQQDMIIRMVQAAAK